MPPPTLGFLYVKITAIIRNNIVDKTINLNELSNQPYCEIIKLDGDDDTYAIKISKTNDDDRFIIRMINLTINNIIKCEDLTERQIDILEPESYIIGNVVYTKGMWKIGELSKDQIGNLKNVNIEKCSITMSDLDIGHLEKISSLINISTDTSFNISSPQTLATLLPETRTIYRSKSARSQKPVVAEVYKNNGVIKNYD